jgi:SAM-dependent methyltransferase
MPHAYNIRLKDAAVHGYAQRHCFLNGPDPALNRRLLAEVLESRVRLGEEQDASDIRMISLKEQVAAEHAFSGMRVPRELGLDLQTVAAWTKNLAWKVHAIPTAARSVLVLGSASGREALFIRHRLPAARIVCADFEDARLPHVEQALGIEFHHGDFNDVLRSSSGSFDVVFSNHVLEHLFEPDKTLALARAALSTSGRFIAALPLDGQPRAPFSDALACDALHPLDMCTIDVAHAWKTNVTELLKALRAAGFDEVELRGRDRYFSVAGRQFSSQDAFYQRARLGLTLNRAVFGTARGLLKRAFPGDVPPLVLKAMFGIEHRFWFGSNRLKNEFSVECLATAG